MSHDPARTRASPKRLPASLNGRRAVPRHEVARVARTSVTPLLRTRTLAPERTPFRTTDSRRPPRSIYRGRRKPRNMRYVSAQNVRSEKIALAQPTRHDGWKAVARTMQVDTAPGTR